MGNLTGMMLRRVMAMDMGPRIGMTLT